MVTTRLSNKKAASENRGKRSAKKKTGSASTLNKKRPKPSAKKVSFQNVKKDRKESAKKKTASTSTLYKERRKESVKRVVCHKTASASTLNYKHRKQSAKKVSSQNAKKDEKESDREKRARLTKQNFQRK